MTRLHAVCRNTIARHGSVPCVLSDEEIWALKRDFYVTDSTVATFLNVFREIP